MAFDLKKIILLIGIVLIPFYELIIRLFPDAIIATPNTRAAKTALALLITLSVVLASLLAGGRYKVNNKWLLALMLFIPINIHLATDVTFVINNMDASSFWRWKPFSYILSYFMLFVCVSNMKVDRPFLKLFNKIVYYSSLTMAFYVFCQFFGLDQFYFVKAYNAIGSVERASLAGNLGQPTIVAPLIAVGVIFAYGLKKYVAAVFMLIILWILHSLMAIGAVIIASLIYIALKNPRFIWVVLVVGVLAGSLMVTKIDVNMLNGRADIYPKIISDWKTSPVEDGSMKSQTFTGIGIGSFGYLFHQKHNSNFYQAHSEPLEILYSLGLFGLILYLMSILYCLQKAYLALDKYLITYITAFILLNLISCGTFVWQISTYQYIGVILFGLLSNQSLIGGEK